MDLNTIYQPVLADLEKVEDRLRRVSEVDFNHLAELLGHSLKGNGKRIRPVLTLLAGKFYHYDLEQLIPMAVAVEIAHTATLVHDDAIDKSPVRRGRPTINKLWDEDKAILLGDYMLAEAGGIIATTNNLRVIKGFTNTIKTISNGELNQSFNAYNLQQDHEQYLQRVAKKTAALFAYATESGAVLSGAPEESIQSLREYAYNLGIAFQIVDDILDFAGTEEELGKPIGSDLAQGTLTLPMMLLMERNPADNPIKRLFTQRQGPDEIKLAIQTVRNSSIIQECYQVASDYCERACRNLKLLPENESRQSLTDLAGFIISRNR